MRGKRVAVLVLSASLAQGLVAPTIAYGLDGGNTDVQTFTSDESVLDTTAKTTEAESSSADADENGVADSKSPSTAGNADDQTDEKSNTSDTDSEQANQGEQSRTDTESSEATASEQAPEKNVTRNSAPTQNDGVNSSEIDKEERDPSEPRPPSKNYTGFDVTRTYWFDKGKLRKNRELYEPTSRQWLYFKADGKKAVNEFVNFDGRTLRYNDDGHMAKGENTIDGQEYFFDLRDGNMKRNIDVYVGSRGGRWVRYDRDGHMVKNREDYFNRGWYHFDRFGTMSKGVTRVSSNGGKWVYYDLITGRMQYGERYLNYDREHTGWYLFDGVTGAMKYGFQHIPKYNKRVYYHEIDGKMRYGEQYIHGKWYYMDKVTGAMARGFVNLPGKRVYYNPKNYQMVYGGAVINDRPYFFDRVTGRQHGRTEIVNKLVSRARSLIRKHPDCPGALAINGGILCPMGPCMSFVWYVFHMEGYDVFLANGGAKNGKQSGWPQDNYDWYARRGRIGTSPKVGDIVFFKFNNPAASWARNANHAGFIVSVSPGRVTMIDAAEGGILERNVNHWGGTIRYATPYYG